MKRAVFQVFGFDLASKGLLAATIILLIRDLPKSQYATYTLATSIVSVLATVVSAAFNRVYIVARLEHEVEGHAETFLAAQFWCCALLALVLAPVAHLLEGTWLPIALLMLGTCWSDFAKTYYQREHAFVRLSLVELGRSGMFLTTTGILIWCFRDVDASHLLLAQSLGMLAVVATVFLGRMRLGDLLGMRRVGRLLRDVSLRDYRYVTGYFILLALVSNASIFLLKTLRGDHDVAAFGSAMKYYNMLSLALAAVHVVLLPSLQRTQNAAELERVLAQHRRLVLPFSLVVATAALAAGWVIPLVDRGAYPDAIPTFRILAASAPISFALSPYVNVLLSQRDFRFIFWVIGLGGAMTVALSAPAVARWGSVGAAWGFFAGFGMINYLVYRRSWAFRGTLWQTSREFADADPTPVEDVLAGSTLDMSTPASEALAAR